MPSSNPVAQLAFQVCPIILTGGTAGQIPGGMLPMLSILQGVGGQGLGLPFDIGDLDDAFGAFNFLPGGTLVSQTIAKYPFANQWVAANATIREPLTISVIMDAPMRPPYTWFMRQAIFTGLKGTLDTHNNNGGTYVVYTPALMYDNMILTSMTDNSRSNNSLPQNAWRFDFERPLVALSDLQGAQNQLMSKITNGFVTNAALTGPQVGSISGQTTYLLDPNTSAGLGGTITQGDTSVMNTAQSYLNYPAIPSSVNAPFSGIS